MWERELPAEAMETRATLEAPLIKPTYSVAGKMRVKRKKGVQGGYVMGTGEENREN